jgi:hypothetical protein
MFHKIELFLRFFEPLIAIVAGLTRTIRFKKMLHFHDVDPNLQIELFYSPTSTRLSSHYSMILFTALLSGVLGFFPHCWFTVASMLRKKSLKSLPDRLCDTMTTSAALPFVTMFGSRKFIESHETENSNDKIFSVVHLFYPFCDLFELISDLLLLIFCFMEGRFNIVKFLPCLCLICFAISRSD